MRRQPQRRQARSVGPELTLRILHDDSGGNFQPPVNQFVDPVLNLVCAEVDHLSPFLIAAEAVPKGFVAPDDDARTCENAFPELSANLLKAMLKCNRGMGADVGPRPLSALSAGRCYDLSLAASWMHIARFEPRPGA